MTLALACDHCGASIDDPDHFEVTRHYGPIGAPDGTTTYHFHHHCLQAWAAGPPWRQR